MRHGIRMAVIALIASVIVEILISIVPIPSPTGSSQALGEHQTIYMLFYVGAPVFVAVWTIFLYCVIVFRSREDEIDPAPRPDSQPILLLWAGVSFIIVLFLAGWGTFTLHEITSPPEVAAAPAHGAKGSSAAAAGPTYSAAHPLVIQAIGQEWIWTFRYPSFGGMETRSLVLPVNTPVLFHVTSLDVVHSLWIYNYDIKEDAVPGVDNTVWLLAKKTGMSTSGGTNIVKCNELCGIWHGFMRTDLRVTSASAFQQWATTQLAAEKASGLLKNLPRYSTIYYPGANANWPPAPQDQSP